MDEFVGIWDMIVDFFTHVSWGSVLTYMGTGGGLIFAADRWLLSHRTPKARLRFDNGEKNISFSPHYFNAVSQKYYVDPPTDCYDSHQYSELVKQYNDLHSKDNVFTLPFRITNTGKLQLEDYRIEIEFNGGIQSISLPIEPVPFMSSWGEKPAPKDLKLNISKKPQIVYSPEDEHPLNQNNHKDFALLFTPQEDVEKIELYWRIIAKDFSDNGKLVIHLKPTIEEYDEFHFMNCERDIPQGAEVIEDLTPYIKQMQMKIKQH